MDWRFYSGAGAAKLANPIAVDFNLGSLGNCVVHQTTRPPQRQALRCWLRSILSMHQHLDHQRQ